MSEATSEPRSELGESEFAPARLGLFGRWMRTWAWALPIGLLLACASAAFLLYFHVAIYRASALLESNRDYLLLRRFPEIQSSIADINRTLVTTPLVLDPVLQDPELRKAPSLSRFEMAESNLRSHLSVTDAGSSDRMLISYSDTDSEAAAEVCNAVVESFLRAREQLDTSRVNKLVPQLRVGAE